MGLIVNHFWKQRISELSSNKLWYSLSFSAKPKRVSSNSKKRFINDEIKIKIFQSF